MMTETPDDTAARGSPELWLQAAREALLDGGIEAVKIQLLAKRLKLSRASFYWFFEDRDQLLQALLAQWRDRNTGSIVNRANAYADSLAEGTLNVCDCWFDQDLFDSRFEFAVRSWALQSPEILVEVQEADTRRIAALTALFERFGRDSLQAEVRARAIYLVQIGYISMQVREEPAPRMARVPGYVRIYCGEAPTPGEMARFHARLRFAPAAVDRTA